MNFDIFNNIYIYFLINIRSNPYPYPEKKNGYEYGFTTIRTVSDLFSPLSNITYIYMKNNEKKYGNRIKNWKQQRKPMDSKLQL